METTIVTPNWVRLLALVAASLSALSSSKIAGVMWGPGEAALAGAASFVLVYGGLEIIGTQAHWWRMQKALALGLTPVVLLLFIGTSGMASQSIAPVTDTSAAFQSRTASAATSGGTQPDDIVWTKPLPTPPPGFVLNATPNSVTQQQPKWDEEANAFIADHPALNWGSNMALMQEKISAIANSRLSDQQVLNAAYEQANADARWTQHP